MEIIDKLSELFGCSTSCSLPALRRLCLQIYFISHWHSKKIQII